MVLKSVGVFSCGKVMAAMYAIFGFLAACMLALMAMAGVAMGNQAGQAAVPGVMVGAGALIFLPILYGIFGFICGIIAAAIYNVLAAIVGGIELEFASTADEAFSRQPPPANW